MCARRCLSALDGCSLSRRPGTGILDRAARARARASGGVRSGARPHPAGREPILTAARGMDKVVKAFRVKEEIGAAG